MKIDTGTMLYGVIGGPVVHSLGPVMHNRAFEHAGYPGVYLAFQVTDLASAITGIKGLDIRGISVTMPYKVSIFDYLDRVDETAQKIGAVNTVTNINGRLEGFNTDGYGALRALAEKTALNGRKVLILGAGGAARGIGFGIMEEGGRITIANRTIKKGEALAESLNADFYPIDEIGNLSFDILINTTPVGMQPDTERIPISEAFIQPGVVVMDIVYRPAKTCLLKMAEDRGCVTVDGVSMFVYQGAMQFERWTGRQAPVDEMKEAVSEALSSQERGTG